MIFFNKSDRKNITLNKFSKNYLRFHSSIYGRVVYIITILALILFGSFQIIFSSVYKKYLNTVIKQSGNNISSIVEGALYYSMLKNDRSSLQNTIDVINTLSGIENINMYDSENNLVHSSLSTDNMEHHNPDCKGCHPDIGTMFPYKEKSFRIISMNSDCQMSQKNYNYRLLLIRSPILNEKSCYTASCHAHKKSDVVLGSLITKIPLNDFDAAVKRTSTNFFLLASFATVFLVPFIILFTNRRIKKPLNAIIKASEAVSNGDQNTRLEIKPNLLSDMRMVSLAFNNMLDNLHLVNKELENWSHQLEYKVQKKSEELSEIQNELIHVEKIASLGKLSSSVAHEINNPLSGVLTYTKLVHKKLSNMEMEPETKESVLKYLSVIEKETKRCGDIVKGLLDFSRKDQQDFQYRHLNEILKETYDLMAHKMVMADISFYTDYTTQSDLIYCNENQIKQACVAILVNSVEAISEHGEILMRTLNPDEDHICLEITDNGIGIDPGDIPHVLEPFFSSKQKVSGIGLGLAVVNGIVQSHKGKIEIESEPGRKTTVRITLPLKETKQS
ncbi:MAG: HAMP domain-containing protein [Bacteroidales bacterium]|nr:HAMP domain-containing protein [Bacteroidales bacterium]